MCLKLRAFLYAFKNIFFIYLFGLFKKNNTDLENIKR